LLSNDAVEVANAVKTAQGDPAKLADNIKEKNDKAMEAKPLPEPQTSAPDLGAVTAPVADAGLPSKPIGINDPNVPAGSNLTWNPTVNTNVNNDLNVNANANIHPTTGLTTAPEEKKTMDNVAMNEAKPLEKKEGLPETEKMEVEKVLYLFFLLEQSLFHIS
jgi:hypothetical protein